MHRCGSLYTLAIVVGLAATAAGAQVTESTPSEDVEQVVGEAARTPEAPFSIADRPIYQAVQRAKKHLSDAYGFSFAIENTTIYQAASGGVDPNDAMVNTLGLFATWKVFRDENGKDFGGLGFQFETRGDPLHDHMTELRDDLGTIWAPNDSTSDDYARVNQLWWGQRFGEGRFGVMVGKIDPGAHLNTNRFAGSGNTQFFAQPFATNPARSFPENGLGFMLRAEPAEWVHVHFTLSDGEAVSSHSPFTTLNGRWLYAAEMALKPTVPGMGPGVYRLMGYRREAAGDVDEFGWSLSADQDLSDRYGVFLRYGGNDAGINAIHHLVAGGFSFLAPFGRPNDQAGVGLAYTHPADPGLRDEYSGEVYYRLQVTEGFEFSASTQLIVDPSAGDEDVVAVFGLRARILF